MGPASDKMTPSKVPGSWSSKQHGAAARHLTRRGRFKGWGHAHASIIAPNILADRMSELRLASAYQALMASWVASFSPSLCS